jgi:hypothetical protein
MRASSQDTALRLVSLLAAAQKLELFWACLDLVPELLRRFSKLGRPLRIRLGRDELIACSVPDPGVVRVQFGAPIAWAHCRESLAILSEIYGPDARPAAGLTGIFEGIRPVLHDLGQILREQDWRLEVHLGSSPFLLLGAGITESIPPGYGPCQLRIPALSRFLARVRERDRP